MESDIGLLFAAIINLKGGVIRNQKKEPINGSIY